MKRYQPLSDYVIVIPPKPPDKTPSGIIIPDTVKDSNKPQSGVVIAVGPGRLTEAGVRLPMYVKAGQNVLFGSYAGVEHNINGQECLVIRQEDLLLAEVEEDDAEIISNAAEDGSS